MSDECSDQQEDKSPGIFSWNELMTTDAEGAQAFYGELFGWTPEAMEMPNGTYHFFRKGERPAAGMFQMPPEMGEVPPHWMPYVTVESIDDSLAKAVSLGGKVIREKTELPMGNFAIIQDPQGAAISFWEFN